MIEDKIEIIRQRLFSSCKQCDGSGYKEDGTSCYCRLLFKVINRLYPRGFPEEYLLLDKDEIFQNIKMDKESKLILDWYLANFEKIYQQGLSLYIYGTLGIGKTSLAILIAKEYALWCLSDDNYIWDFNAYYMDIQTFSDFLKKEDFIESEKWTAKFFVLDEFGRDAMIDKSRDWIIRGIERFLRYRIANGLPTIICSNITPERLYELYGEGISSLLGVVGNEMSGLAYRAIKLEGTDLRRGWIKSR